jgi:integrase
MASGHIRPRGKSGKSWELKFDARRDPVTGRRKIQYVNFKGTKRQAQVRLAELIAAVGTGSYVDPSKTTVAELVAERIALWRNSGRISAKTEERRQQLAKSQIGRIGNTPIQKLDTRIVEQWHAGMLADGLAPRTVRDAHSLLAQAIDEAVRHKLVLTNPARLQRPPRGPHEEVEIIPAELISPTLAKLEGHPFYVPVVVALYCGCRRSEMLALSWADADFDRRTLRIERALEETRAGGIAIAPTKSRRSRTISLPEVVITALRQHRKAQLELRLALGMGKPDGTDLIFPDHAFGHQSPRNFSTRWQYTAKRLGLPRVTWHAWRHAHAAMLIDAKVDIASISKRLGHASPAITLSIYAHCFKQDDQAVADAIDALVR